MRRSDCGNELWRALSDDVGNGREVIDKLEEEDVTITNVTLLIAHLINDSKYNVAKKNKFYSSSKAFLLNEGRALENWLSMVHIDDVDLVLWKLREFVYNGNIDKLGYLRRLV